MQIDVSRHFGLAEDPFRPRDGGEDAKAPTSLNQDQARGFVRDRLASAGARTSVFSRAALDAVVGAAGGVRHRLRWLAGLAMLEAALDGSRRVEEAHVKAAVAQAAFAAAPVPPEKTDAPAHSGRRSWWSSGVVSGLTAATVVVLALLVGASLIGPVAVHTIPPHRLAGHRNQGAAMVPRSGAFASSELAPTLVPIVTRPEPAREPALSTPTTMGVDEPIRATAVVRFGPPRPSPAPSRIDIPLIASKPPAAALPPPLTPVSQALDEGSTPASRARVFIHYLPPDRFAAEEVARRLSERGWAVTALREVDAVVRQPNTRFFYDADGRAATDLSDDLADTLGEPVGARDMRDYPKPPRPGTLEVWLPPQG